MKRTSSVLLAFIPAIVLAAMLAASALAVPASRRVRGHEGPGQAESARR